MNILQYVNFLEPVLEKRELLRDLDQIQVEFTDTLKPVVDEVQNTFVGVALKSNLFKRFETSVKRNINTNQHPLALVFNSLEDLDTVINTVKKEIKANMGIQFTNKSLSFSKANTIKLVDGLGFYVKYSRRFLLALVTQEANVLGNATKDSWTPAERAYIDESLDQFIALIPTMLKNETALKRDFNKASDALIEEDTFALSSSSIPLDRQDPFGINNFSPRQNPFVMLGKWKAEYKHSRYLLAKEEAHALQLRLEELRNLKAQEPTNPVIQKQIQAYEKRVSDFEFKIAKIEEAAGLR